MAEIIDFSSYAQLLSDDTKKLLKNESGNPYFDTGLSSKLVDEIKTDWKSELGNFSDNPPTGLVNYTLRSNKIEGIQIFPGIYSTDDRYLSTCMDIRETLEAEMPGSNVERQPNGYTGHGDQSDRTAMFAVGGALPSDAGIMPINNLDIAKRNLGKRAESDPEVKKYLESNMEWIPEDILLIWDIAIPLLVQIDDNNLRSIPVKASSNAGLPTADSNLGHKRAIEERWNIHHKEMFSLFEKEDYNTLLNDYYVSTAYMSAYRTQQDGWKFDDQTNKWKPKERVVYSYTGQTVTQDKTLPNYLLKSVPQARAKAIKQGFDLTCSRARVVNMSAASGQLPGRMIAANLMHSMFANFPDLTHMSTREELNEKVMSQCDAIFMFDIGNHDQMFPPILLRMITNYVNKYFTKGVNNMFTRGLFAPSFVRNSVRNKHGARFIGNHLGQGPQCMPGNPSGFAATTFYASIGGILLWLAAVHRTNRELDKQGLLNRQDSTKVFYAETAEMTKAFVLSLLSSQPTSTVKGANKGDNSMCGLLRGLYKKEAFRIYEKLYENSLPCTKWDSTDAWAGMIPLVDSNGNGSFQRRYMSYLMRWFWAERPINGKDRINAAAGWFIRKEDYASCPQLDQIDDIINFNFKKNYGITPDELMQASLESRHDLDVLSRTKSIYDVQFLLEPDVINWKFGPEMVSPELLSEYYYSIPPENYSQMWQHMRGKAA